MQNLTDEIKDLLLTRSLLLQMVSNSLTKDIVNAYVSVIDDILAQIATGKNINLINMNKIIKELNAKLTPDLTIVNDDLVQLGISEASYVANVYYGGFYPYPIATHGALYYISNSLGTLSTTSSGGTLFGRGIGGKGILIDSSFKWSGS